MCNQLQVKVYTVRDGVRIIWRGRGVSLSPSLSPCFVQEGAGGEKDEMDYIWFFNFTFDSSTINPTVQTLHLKPTFETVLIVHKSPNRLATYVGWTLTCSGGSRNLERGVQPLAHEAHPQVFWVATPTSGHFNTFVTRNSCLYWLVGS